MMMKRWIGLLLCVLLLFSCLISCRSERKGPKDPEAESQAESHETEKEESEAESQAESHETEKEESETES
ncbi:MAG: hypothetical protein IKA76_08470, partial [Clostridia bacterium]|nr:hypothetical protein [Clostridia bacterium]